MKQKHTMIEFLKFKTSTELSQWVRIYVARRDVINVIVNEEYYVLVYWK